LMLLLTGITGYEDVKWSGWLYTPRCHNTFAEVLASNKPYACDNDCFNKNWNREAFISMLQQVAGQPRLMWVTVPDVVADGDATLKRFRLWLPVFRHYAIPACLVAQNGMTPEQIPWDDITAVFIGGDTEWKLSRDATAIAKEAKSRGKWLHMGRVNSLIRISYAKHLQCDSIDGTQWVKWRKKYRNMADFGMSQGVLICQQ
jgi:hypothetical protein